MEGKYAWHIALAGRVALLLAGAGLMLLLGGGHIRQEAADACREALVAAGKLFGW